MIAQDLEASLQFVYRDARVRQLEFVIIEHLVLALVDSSELVPLFKELGTDRRALRNDLEQYITKHNPRAKARDPRPTPAFSRLLRRAIKDGRSKPVTGIDVLAAVHQDADSYAARYLHRHGVTRMRVAEWLHRQQRSRTAEQTEKSEPSDDLTYDLTQAAIEGRLEVPLHRPEIVNATLLTLARKYKSNPVLVGEPGVGKTAIVHSIVHMARSGRWPAALANLSVHEVNVASLVAGTKYRGDFEARIKSLVATMSQKPGAVLFVDDIHTLVGAGSVSGGALDAANILKPALVNGTLRCIGATTHAEYARSFAGDAALTRRFQKIEVPEPTHDEAVAILRELKPRLQRHHGVTFESEALDAAVRLSTRYISSRHLPDKAIDLLDEAGADAALEGRTAKITARHLGRTVAKISGMPLKAINKDLRAELRGLERTLSRNVFGQPQAVSSLASAVKRARLGARGTDQPVGSFLFAGPTGVGKTEMAKSLAAALSIKLLRYDMSEHMERHSVSRLIGAPPGYVGFDQRGLLTDQVSHHPHCVVLLDEIEKAHPDVFSVFLQVMDRGVLTDSSGATADFRHAVIIMTTNAGAAAWESPPLGFSDATAQDDELAAIQRLFTPEFRNRLTAVIPFSPLDRSVAKKVVGRELAKVEKRLLAERDIHLQCSPRLSAWVLDHGFSESFGARPLQRTIDDKIVNAVVDEDARKELAKGTVLRLDCDAAGVVTATRKKTRAAPRRAKAKTA